MTSISWDWKDFMKKILLSQNQIALVDDWNYEWLSQWKWFATWNKDTQSFYAKRNGGTYPNRKTISMHREIMKTPIGMICDHKNHNTLLNIEENLRKVTPTQSNMNRRILKENSLKERCIRKTPYGFQVRVEVGGVMVHDKFFKDLDEAIASRNWAICLYHGEYANLEKRDG